MPRLSTAALPSLDPMVAVPDYDRSALTAGIVHIGVGGFHRAHEAMYLDRLLAQGEGREWAVCGVGVLAHDAAMRDALREQDCLYTLVVKHPDGSLEPRVIGSLVEYLFAPDDPEVVVERLAAPSTRIVSLTITEGGYNTDPATGRFDVTTPAVAADLGRTEGWTTVFGLVVEALRRRRERGVVPFTVLSCDNIEGNGEVARGAFAGYAAARDAELGRWVHDEVRFPSTMVDRITPATADGDRTALAEATGVQDAWPVVCEPFTQWVVEDTFPAGRPALEKVGVQLVGDVRPYELMKLRLLNASHQALCYFAHFSGYTYVHDAAGDPLIRRLLVDYMDLEGTPTLEPVPGVDLAEYKATLIARFSNPAVRDTVARLCAESSDRIPQWLVPVIRENLAAGRDVRLSAAVVASWARYARGVDERGEAIAVVDRLADVLTLLALADTGDAFLGHRELFGDLIDDARFRDAYTWAWESLRDHGAQQTLASLLGAGHQGDVTPIPSTMQRAIAEPLVGVRLEEAPVPTPGPGELLVRTSLVGICGSDTHSVAGHHPFLDGAYVPGHEATGVVVAAGEGAGRLAVGQRVLLKPNVACGACDNCLADRSNACENLTWIGCDPSRHWSGAMAHYFVAPEKNLYAVPDAMDDATATLVECLGTPVHAARIAGDLTGARVVVLGAGTIGVLCVVAALHAGAAQVVVTDMEQTKIDRAVRVGAVGGVLAGAPGLADEVRGLLGGPVDVVFDCVANERSLAQAVGLLRRAGTLLIVGVPPRPGALNLPIVQDWELRVQGCAAYTEADVETAIRIAAEGGLPTAEIVSGTFSLAEVSSAFERAAADSSGKVMVAPN